MSVLEGAGKIIEDARVARGWSVTTAAAGAAMSWDTWTRIEGGDESVSVATLKRAASLLGLEVFVELDEA